MFKGSEIFSSLQGEGILTGVPMVFVRFAFCNLQCTWCDTKYSWKEEYEWSVDDILKKVWMSTAEWVCLTGGEPLLWDLDKLIERLTDAFKVTVETNGTLMPSDKVFHLTSLWSVSPKLTNSGMVTKRNDKAVAKFLTHRNTQLKFVCEGAKDVMEALQYVNEIEKTFMVSAKSVPIVFQPQGMLKPQQVDFDLTPLEKSMTLTHAYLRQLKELWCFVQGCKGMFTSYDLRVLPQLHRLVFGQGVRKV